MAFNLPSTVNTFIEQTTQETMRTTGLGLYITQTSNSGLTLNSGHTIRIQTTGVTDVTLPTSGTLVTTASLISDLAATTSAALKAKISDETGSGGALVFATSPTLSAPTFTGNTTVATINNLTLTAPATAATLTLANNSSLTTSGAFATTFTFTAGTSVTFPTSGTLYGTASGSITSLQLKTSLTDETGSGAAVFATSPTLVAPILGNATCSTINALTLTIASSGEIEFPSPITFTLPSDDLAFNTSGGTTVTLPTTGTLATLSGSESLSNKTVVTPVISTGLTASGSAANNFSGSTGTFITSSGLTTISGGLVFAIQALSGSGSLGAVNVTTPTTTVSTSGAATGTLGDGTSGQVKTIIMISDGGDWVLTVSNLRGGTTITFADAGDAVTLQFIGTRWEVLSNNGTVIA